MFSFEQITSSFSIIWLAIERAFSFKNRHNLFTETQNYFVVSTFCCPNYTKKLLKETLAFVLKGNSIQKYSAFTAKS